MNYIHEYQEKLRTPEAAVKVVQSGDWVDYGFGTNQPILLDEALAKRKPELQDIKIRGALTLKPRQIVSADLKRECFTYCSWHFSGYDRQLHDRNLCSFIPMIYRNMPRYYRNELVVDVAMICVAPMDKHGYFNFSLSTSATQAALETAKIVIVEVNEQFPRALGGREECIHISEVDYIVESNQIGIPELPVAVPDEIDEKVARLIVEEVVDRSILQLGIGGMPNAVGNLIAESDVKDLGMHTEMLVDAYLAMYKKGKLTNKYKQIDKGKSVWNFSAGSRELYDWIDQNPFLAVYPVEYTNDPAVIRQLDHFISVNNCVEVDLYGQISSESSGIRQISGTGGQLDFVTGAYLSRGGKSFICFRSSYTNKKTGVMSSCVVPTLPAGGIVTAPRTQAHYLVNEWGKVNLAGCSTWERAEKIISIAHPNFQNELIQHAEQMKIWRRSNKR
ncbi:acetyl-CoA hydrolase/transferase family protein [Sporomusa acidovorans]|uniref:Probable butyrate:acetyl-CoA coenzyme A-transferase n=1 Tax=Sporomusa acidovorans (strain ATCC 49682 / DSM 3132 / Mol) TaxID=1123286 RepID=A0ABZ3IVD3_SPOA4|nr:acetyl-CoA hydrolase/transferase C-terminal domain-containing protein [Sporomusa acidovorans]OZC22642.1 succinyl-CoA:coenzyme A transferase [Sporomusa acidovorans DSM 3132]SDE76759.1 butyryl-CoA:acetate CoA-transferase [Sporomusa acidovorans]